MMDEFQMDHQALYHLGKNQVRAGTLDDVLEGCVRFWRMKRCRTAEQVRAFLRAPDGDTALNPQQQMVAISDQMLRAWR